jgi:hypothetical protein
MNVSAVLAEEEDLVEIVAIIVDVMLVRARKVVPLVTLHRSSVVVSVVDVVPLLHLLKLSSMKKS